MTQPKISHWHSVDREKRCISCNGVFPLSAFSAYGYTTNQGKSSVRYESRCKECNRARRNARFADPEKREIDMRTSLAWKHENRERLAAYRKARQQTPEFRELKAKAQRMRKARIRAGAELVRDPAIAEIYAKAMEMQRATGVKYHVDHIIPLKHGGKHVAENLQVLTATENMRKGASITRPAITGENNA